MSRPTTQAENSLSPLRTPAEIRHRLIDRNLSVATLARVIRHPRTTVSQAIHHQRFPKVRAKVEALLWP